MKPNPNSLCILVDNGSLRNHAVLFTRKLARDLERKTGMDVIPASLAHSHQIDPSELQGEPAQLLETILAAVHRDGKYKKILVLPLLLIQGGAIYRKIEKVLSEFVSANPGLEMIMGQALVSCEDAPESSIPGILKNAILRYIEQEQLMKPEVIVVDHGSPLPISGVTRDWVATTVREMIGSGPVASISAASMERREGAAYDFNEPLLERALIAAAEKGVSDVVVAKLFLQPGRHAGKRGDIDSIINNVTSQYPQINIRVIKQSFPQNDLVMLLSGRISKFNESTKFV